MKKILFGLFAMALTVSVSAQKFYSKDGNVAFDANSPLEKIEGKTNKGTLVIDAATSKLESAVLIKGFHFTSALMEEHFNENYMESGKFPKATFAGTYTGFTAANLKKNGTYPIVVKGNLTMHGVTKPVESKGILTVKGGGFVFFPQRLFLQVIGVGTGVAPQFAAFQFNDAVAHIFEEIPVVRHHEQGDAW